MKNSRVARTFEVWKNLAQVSDAGMPSISDPGHDLVKAAIAEDITVVALPGASAGITALIASGLAPQPHIFMGSYHENQDNKRLFESKKPILKHKSFMNHLIACQIP